MAFENTTTLPRPFYTTDRLQQAMMDLEELITIHGYPKIISDIIDLAVHQ